MARHHAASCCGGCQQSGWVPRAAWPSPLSRPRHVAWELRASPRSSAWVDKQRAEQDGGERNSSAGPERRRFGGVGPSCRKSIREGQDFARFGDLADGRSWLVTRFATPRPSESHFASPASSNLKSEPVGGLRWQHSTVHAANPTPL